MPNWIERFNRAFPDEEEIGLQTNPPATAEEIAAITEETGLKVPADLAAALAESNGLSTPTGENALLTTADIISWCNEHRVNYADWEACEHVNELLFFSDVGTGDYYAYRFPQGKPAHIVLFDHETGDIMHRANDLAGFLEYVTTHEEL